ncbi:MAG: carbohydrate ABC transporter permease [Clostridia bacterium]|nr:carbohydrate ABC transporter permease [Clostridia bacterium]
MVKSKSARVANVLNIAVISLLTLTFIIPVILILSASVSTANSFAQYGYTLIPQEIDFFAYQYVLFSNSLFVRALGNSIFVTVVGTLMMVANCALYAFALVQKDFVGKKLCSIIAIFTMLFAGGTIPYYLVVTGLGLENSLWSIILPGSISAWNILLMRNFFNNIPPSLTEAAGLDGASHVQVLVKVVLPTSFPVIATVILFTAVGFWNNWFGPLLFIDKNHREIAPIQSILREVVQDASAIVGQNTDLPTEAIKNATVVVATLPIVIVYPVLQKYFINGVILGSVKE